MDESPAYTVGSVVKCWNGERFGVITEMYRVTAKVRHIGGRQDHNAMVEKRYHRDVLEMHSEAIPQLSGAKVKLVDWQRAQRDAIVLEQDGPFLLVRYVIKDGRQREVWTDLGRVNMDDHTPQKAMRED